MTTQCTYCGEGVPPHSMFCGSCGQLVASRPVAVPPPLGGGPDSAGTAPPATRAAAPPPAVPLPPVIGGRPVPPAPPPPPPPPPPMAPTIVPNAAAPRSVASSVPVTPAPAAALSVRLPDGPLVAVTSPVVLGRKPTSDIAPLGFTPVTVADPARSMSRSHITLEPENGHLLLSDLGSANGTTLERGGVRSRITPTSGRVPVYDGDRIWLGRVAIDIV